MIYQKNIYKFYKYKGSGYMAKIMVDPSKLEMAANKMEQQAADYAKLYKQLFT